MVGWWTGGCCRGRIATFTMVAGCRGRCRGRNAKHDCCHSFTTLTVTLRWRIVAVKGRHVALETLATRLATRKRYGTSSTHRLALASNCCYPKSIGNGRNWVRIIKFSMEHDEACVYSCRFFFDYEHGRACNTLIFAIDLYKIID